MFHIYVLQTFLVQTWNLHTENFLIEFYDTSLSLSLFISERRVFEPTHLVLS